MRKFSETMYLDRYIEYTGLTGVGMLRNDEGPLYLFSSHDIGFYLAKLCSDVFMGKNNTFTFSELKKLQVNILETEWDENSLATEYPYISPGGGKPSPLKLRHFYWHTQLSKNNKLRSKCPLNLTPHIRVTVKGIEACYRNKGYKSFVMGVYNNVKDAQAWFLKAQEEIKEGRLVNV